MNEPIATERLDLVPATPELLRAALGSRDRLASALRARVPESWPPRYLDDAAIEYTLARLAEGERHAGWWMYFILLREPDGGRTLVGSGGYAGPPGPEGTVEVGYGIVADHQRRGYASEAVRGLVKRAFARPEIARVTAQTLPELKPSIGVLLKCGFRHAGPGADPEAIRFDLLRPGTASTGREGT
ncbi:MAG TPA: GNAT family protein [Candidatus Polarisedimenticolia bacterium]|nr:GNAT family protein [Candidatus Polarisedimenticolia bacterium]